MTFLDELLYVRRYALLFERGYRGLDLRRFGRTKQLVREDPAYQRNIRYPTQLQECTGVPMSRLRSEPLCAAAARRG